MDQLTAQVAQKTGISEDQARQAVETVISFLKKRLPAPIAGQIDSALGGGGKSKGEESAGGGGLGNVLGG